jgi:hypothetical protein
MIMIRLPASPWVAAATVLAMAIVVPCVGPVAVAAQPLDADPGVPPAGRFYQVYVLRMGMEHGNLHYRPADKWFRVNSPGVSLMKNIKDRHEVRANGLMILRADTDITSLERAELYLEVWGGHPGTKNKRVIVNGRSTYALPAVGSATQNCTHVYPTIPLKVSDLVNGYNAFQFACDKDSGWGHFIVHDARLRLGLPEGHPTLHEAGLATFAATVRAAPQIGEETIRLSLAVDGKLDDRIASVTYQGFYTGYDENGNGLTRDWHGLTNDRKFVDYLGTSTEAPFATPWDLTLLPDQDGMAVRAIVRFREPDNLIYVTRPVGDLRTPARPHHSVALYSPKTIPVPFWSRASRKKECCIFLDMEPEEIERAELRVVVWGRGAGSVREYFKLNGHFFPIAAPKDAGPIHYSRLTVPPAILRKGENRIELLSDTEHHGIEILLPGPAIMVRSQRAEARQSAKRISKGIWSNVFSTNLK